MKEFDFSTKTTKELEERLDYLFNVAVEKNKERSKQPELWEISLKIRSMIMQNKNKV